MVATSPGGLRFSLDSRDTSKLLRVVGNQVSLSALGRWVRAESNCWDNSPTERFFRSLKHEQLNYEKFKTKIAAKLSVIYYLAFYNGCRAHSTLGYQFPLEFERGFYRTAA